MPPLTREELKALIVYSSDVYPTIDCSYTLLEMFDLVGPSLKTIEHSYGHTLKKTDNIFKDLHNFLWPIRQLVQNTGTERWKKAGGDVDSWIHLSTSPPNGYHRLFTLLPIALKEGQDEDDLFTLEPDFITVIASNVLARKRFSQTFEMLPYVTPCSGRADCVSEIRGAVFQTLALRTFSFTDDDSIIHYSDTQDTTIIFGYVPTAKSLLDFDVMPREGLLHVAPRYTATFDGLYLPIDSQKVLLFQITVGREHDIKDSGLQKIWNTFESGRQPEDSEVIFVVPDPESGKGQCKPILKVIWLPKPKGKEDHPHPSWLSCAGL